MTLLVSFAGDNTCSGQSALKLLWAVVLLAALSLTKRGIAVISYLLVTGCSTHVPRNSAVELIIPANMS